MAEPGASEKMGDVASAIENDAELHAMRTVLGALVPLKREGRTRVLDYVLNRLGMVGETGSSVTESVSTVPLISGKSMQAKDIRSLKDEKSPRTANQMAALVAYYLAELAPERKQTITVDDIKRYFIEGNFPLPTKPEQSLVNAKNAGYFQSAGAGQYRLNSVGYNLVVHKLPDASGPIRRQVRRPRSGRSRRAKKPPRK